jgi:hypothetical protein
MKQVSTYLLVLFVSCLHGSLVLSLKEAGLLPPLDALIYQLEVPGGILVKCLLETPALSLS